MTRIKSIVPLLLVGMFASLPVAAQSTDEQISGAVLPLPEDLRADATVFNYDTDTGERIVLRVGSNHVECQPKNDDGFTRCYPVSDAARRDYSAKLSAEGLSGDELQNAMAAAVESGEVPARAFGSLMYRLYDKDDRIQLLWVVMLPNATSENLGMPTGSQRDNSLAGQGRPWMMREGTPGAHLMIPINGTMLSNQP
ncbi:MAG: hypothetical protein HOM55_07760 [Proteobacteria bacterium]|jgi:hypothetical protein|nr:hypothetical protein [Pseudomonadota bacterium]